MLQADLVFKDNFTKVVTNSTMSRQSLADYYLPRVVDLLESVGFGSAVDETERHVDAITHNEQAQGQETYLWGLIAQLVVSFKGGVS